MDIRFHLPSFTTHFRFNMVFISILENYRKYFYDNVVIASVFDAFPQSLWNGGRLCTDTCDDHFTRVVMKTLNEHGIPLRFTFTNPLIEKKHLSDKFCNKILERGRNSINEVIVFSPVLEEYIRKNYPEYKITSSTCKRLNSIDLLNEELEKDYKYVVMDYDLNNHFDLLEKVKPEHRGKCEILVNAICQPDCPNRSKHYASIAKQQMAYCDYIYKGNKDALNLEKILTPEERKIYDCPHMGKNFFQIKNLCTHVSPDDIFKKYLPMGFNNFKLEGRSTNSVNLMEQYLYYMVKPEYRDETRYLFLQTLKGNDIIQFD